MSNLNSQLTDENGNNLYPITTAGNVSGLAGQLASLANIDGSNIQKSNYRSYLGIGDFVSIASSITYRTTTKTTIDLSNLIPSWVSGAVYQIYGYAVVAGTTYNRLWMSSDIMTADYMASYAGSAQNDGGPFVMEAGRYLYYRNSASSSYDSTLYIYGCRRIK